MKNFKKIMLSVFAVALSASVAFAGGNSNNSGSSQEQGQYQGQHQGQDQRQSTDVDVRNSNSNRNSNENSNRNSNSNSNSNAAGATSNNSVDIEGSVSLSALGATDCGGFGLTAGAPGAGAIGLNISGAWCKQLAMAAAAQAYGGSGAAYLCEANRAFRASQPALCGSRTAITDQTYHGGGKGAAIATRAAPLYTSCRVEGNTPYVTVPAGTTEAGMMAAGRACFATR